MHLSFSFLALGAALFSLSHASGLATFDHLKTLTPEERVRIFGEATSDERWTFFQDKYQNYLKEHKDSLTKPQIKALKQAITFTKTKDGSLLNAVKDDLFETLGRDEAADLIQVTPPAPIELGKRGGGNCECSIGWPDSCRDSPIGPVCHLGEPGSPYECVPDIGKPCAEYPDGTVTYCDGFCGS